MILSAGVLSAQVFLTGQSARAEFGQDNFTAQADDQQVETDVTVNEESHLGGVSGLAYANSLLFVVDSNRLGSTPDDDRVMVYPTAAIPLRTAKLTQDTYLSPCAVCAVQPSFALGLHDDTDDPVNNPNAPAGTTGPFHPLWMASGITQNGFNEPTAVATDGTRLVVADTNNNRVLIWNTIPTTTGQNADLVLGQTSFTSIGTPSTTQSTMKAPEGVWIQGNRLFVADTDNNRILIWNNFPTQNGQQADLVLGQPNFTTTQSESITVTPQTTASNMITPVGVSSDGVHLFVADLGQNRILIWNSIPTQNNQPADVEIGQPNMTSNTVNNSFTGTEATSSTDTTDKETPVLCTVPVPGGNDPAGNPTYPQRCAYTLDWPRMVITDGTRLFVADGGNDRVLIYNTIPTQNAVAANIILGEPDEFTDQVSDSGEATDNVEIASADSIRTPSGLAWDGTNLYVSDPYSRRVSVFTGGDQPLPYTASLNSASLETFASAVFTFAGTITTGEKVTVTITNPNPTSSTYTAPTYTYTVQKNDTFDTIAAGLANVINAAPNNQATNTTPDPEVTARAEIGVATILLSAETSGAAGDGIEFSIVIAGVNNNAATLTVSPSSGTTDGGVDAARLAPGMLVTLFGTGFTDQGTIAEDTSTTLPREALGTEVYVDGERAPLLYVSPTQINLQIPYEYSDRNGSTAWVRVAHANGTVTATNSIAFPLAPQNPGIFAYPGSDPRMGVATQSSSSALAVIDIEGLPDAASVASVTIGSSTYSYTIQTSDVAAITSLTLTNMVNGQSVTTTAASTSSPITPDPLEVVRYQLMNQINNDPNAQVTATEGSQFHYLILTAKTPGAAGNGISVTTSATAANSSSLTLTVLTTYNSNTATCCASDGGSVISTANPAVPGGFLTIYAAGLGTPTTGLESNGQYCPIATPSESQQNFNLLGVICTPTPAPGDGVPYSGPIANGLTSFVSSIAGGSTANVFNIGLVPGVPGVYELLLQLDSSLTTNPLTPLTIYQDVYHSNTVTIPVQAP